MNDNNDKFIPHQQTGFSIQLMSSIRMRAHSVVEIDDLNSFDATGAPTMTGLYSPLMGPIQPKIPCEKCWLKIRWCRGHFGRIEFPKPVFNPIFIMEISRLLKMTCLACHHLMLPVHLEILYFYQMKAADRGLFHLIPQMEEFQATKEFNERLKLCHDTACQIFMENYDKIISETKIKEEFKQSELYQMTYKQIIRNIFQTAAKVKKICLYCNYPRTRIVKIKSQFTTVIEPDVMEFANTEEIPEKLPDPKEYPKGYKMSNTVTYLLTPLVVMRHFRLLIENEGNFLKKMYGSFVTWNALRLTYPTDAFFLELILVPPNYMRPVTFSSGVKVENPQTLLFKNVLSCALSMKLMIDSYYQEKPEGEALEAWNNVKGPTKEAKLMSVWNKLQTSVNHIYDSSSIRQGTNCLLSSVGIRQIIEKKEGLLRSNIMAKRVNHCARSVIVPDPLIDVGEVGIPEAFARKLTVPELVFSLNMKEMKQLVLNGPDIYPGALEVQLGDSMFRIPADKEHLRKKLAELLERENSSQLHKVPRNTVYRHMRNGDYVLINRQPTLHRPSLMAHRARVLPGEKTLRIHYANCKSYNADFDGDELNLHLPQTLMARAEAAILVSAEKQFLSPKDGSPLKGLIQDHILAAFYLTLRNNVLSRNDYMQLVATALPPMKEQRISLLPPALVKPGPHWTGKQVISTIIYNLVPKDKALPNLIGKAKIEPKMFETQPSRPWLAGGDPFENPYTMSESEVIFRQGELMSGILDKNQLGTSEMCLFHLCYELYGYHIAHDMISGFSRMLNMALERNLFSISCNDPKLTKKGWKKIRKYQKNFEETCLIEVKQALGLPPDADLQSTTETLRKALLQPGSGGDKIFDKAIKSVTGPFTKKVAAYGRGEGAQNKLLNNRLALMINSGAKGSSINLQQITTLLGQVDVGGKRIQNSWGGRSNPVFDAYDPSAQNGGFCLGNLTRGLPTYEAHFHAMAAREGMCDTAVKTATSGYLQRCLIKSLESISVAYDNTVRNGDGSIISFIYGGNGLSVTEKQMLKLKNFPSLLANYQNFLDRETIQKAKERSIDTDKVKEQKTLVKKWRKKYGDSRIVPSAFDLFVDDVLKGDRTNVIKKKPKLIKKWRKLSDSERQYYRDAASMPNPVISVANPATTFGCVPEKMDEMINEFIKSSPEIQSGDPIGKKDFRDMVYYKYQRALVEPGEPVGILAAQSIGEPSTQMTLNTFHFAGNSDMNMTLGIPRLNEILKTATPNISTPTMYLYFKPTHSKRKMAKNVQLVVNYLTPVNLAKVIHKANIRNLLLREKGTGKMFYGTKVRFQLLSAGCYEPITVVKKSQVIPFIKKYFLAAISSGVQAKLNSKKKKPMVSMLTNATADDGFVNQMEADDIDEPMPKDPEEKELESASDMGAEDEEAEEEEEEEEMEVTVKEIKEEEEEMEEKVPQEEEDIQLKEEVVSMEKTTKEILSIPYIPGILYNSQWVEFLVAYQARKPIDVQSMVLDLIESKYLHKVPGVTRAFASLVDDGKGGKEPLVTTEGVNLQGVTKLSHIIDLSRLYTNDIHLILKTYGVEATYNSIIKEVSSVFSMYGIDVDYAHLSLVADYMTHLGGIRGCNYIGLANNPSIMQKMSFERAMATITEAALRGSKDNLGSVSSRMAYAQPVKVGTGTFELLDKK